MSTFNIVMLILLVLTFVAGIIILAGMAFQHKRKNYNKENRWVDAFFALFVVLVIIMIVIAIHDMAYLSGFEEGIYSIDVSKLEEVASETGNSALESLHNTTKEMGTEEVKISRSGDWFHIIFPNESYDTEITINANNMEILEEYSVISLVKEQ